MVVVSPTAAHGTTPGHARPRWTDSPAVAVAYSALLAYGTLLPFGFTGEAESLASLLTAPRWLAWDATPSPLGVPAWLSDVATNLALYAPLGAILRLAIGRWLVSVMATGIAVVLAATLSWGLECLQSLSPDRVASLNDWSLNTLGAAAGALLALTLRDAMRTATVATHRRLLARWMPDAAESNRGATRVLVLLGIGAVALVAWPPAPLHAGDDAWLPFLAAFRQPYDVAAMTLSSQACVYGLLTAAVLAVSLRHGLRSASRHAVAIVAAFAMLRQVLLLGPEASFDPTEPLVALGAAASIIVAAHAAARGVALACRRRRRVPVAVERRRAAPAPADAR